MMYKTVKSSADAEFVEKKSRFISHVLPVKTEQEALDFINGLKSKYWDATHNVYAYVLRDNNIQRYSDDGEPSGTAGVPVLDVIRKEGLTDTAVVVTRYFGGTLLGAGGLVRAYTKSAKLGVDAAGVVTMGMCGIYRVTVDYDLLGRAQNTIAQHGSRVDGAEYKENVELNVIVSDENGFEEMLVDALNGRVRIKRTGEKFIPVER